MKLPSLKLLFLPLFFAALFTGCNGKDEPEPVKPEPISEPAAGKVYVANEHAGSISVIDAKSGTVQKTIVVNADDPDLMAHNVQVAPDGKTVWVTGVPMTHRTPEQLIIIDAGADTIKYRIIMQQHYHLAHLVFDPSSAYVFVTATDAGQVLKVNAKTQQIEQTYVLPTGAEPHGLRYSNGKLYVANLTAKIISEIDVATGQIQHIPVNGMAVQSAISPDGKYVFATLFDTKEVVRYNIQTKQLDRVSLPAGAQGPIQLYPTPDSKKLYVCDQGILLGKPVSDKVFVLDIETLTVTQTITAGKGPHGVIISQDGRHAFVTNTRSATVSVIDTNTDKEIKTIPVGITPNGISYLSESGGMP